MSAASEADKDDAIRKGLAYLRTMRAPAGASKSVTPVSAVDAALAFTYLQQQKQSEFRVEAQSAIETVLSTATLTEVTTRGDGTNICPGTQLSCKGIFWQDTSGSMYTTGLAARAIATYGVVVGPGAVATLQGALSGMTWAQISQGITNMLAASQNSDENAVRYGGWPSLPGSADADMFDTHWAVVSLLYDETLGAITPGPTRTDLKIWLGNVQDSTGKVCFQPSVEPCDHAETGAWLAAMRFAGYEVNDPQVQAALGFLNSQWRAPAENLSYGNFGHPYAMWTIYYGLQLTDDMSPVSHISNFLTDCGAGRNALQSSATGTAACSWREDYDEWLVTHQKPDGSWDGYGSWSDLIATAFYLDILSASRIPVPVQHDAPTKATASSVTSEKAAALIPVPAIASPSPNAFGSPGTSDESPQPILRRGTVPRYVRKGVTGLAVKSDGTMFATAGSDNVIRIWSTSSRALSAALSGLRELPDGLIFNQAGTMLASVGRDSLLRFWDVRGGKLLANLSGHDAPIRAVAASRDGKFIGTAGEDTRVMLWDVTQQKLNKVLSGSRDFVNTLSFSPDNRRLAAGGQDARIIIYDVTTGKPVFTLRGHSGPIYATTFSPDGSMVATAGADMVVHLWNAATGTQKQALTGHSAPVRALAFSPDNRLLASAGEDNQIRLWSSTGTLRRTLSGSSGNINAVAFLPLGNNLISANDAGTIDIWNVLTGIRLWTIKAH
jgi:WD40 repeat protein